MWFYFSHSDLKHKGLVMLIPFCPWFGIISWDNSILTTQYLLYFDIIKYIEKRRFGVCFDKKQNSVFGFAPQDYSIEHGLRKDVTKEPGLILDDSNLQAILKFLLPCSLDFRFCYEPQHNPKNWWIDQFLCQFMRKNL